MRYIVNAFSLSMLSGDEATLSIEKVTQGEARHIVEDGPYVSAVGHQTTADLFTSLLGVTVGLNRTNVILGAGDELLVGQYSGPRLPEGATKLPEGAVVTWWVITGRFS
jgi:hypothetical protein